MVFTVAPSDGKRHNPASTQVFSPAPTMDEREREQLVTALRLIDNREVVFARSALIVEDESLFEFLKIVAPKIGRDIDSNGVSVLFTEGDPGHRPAFSTLVDHLGIPAIYLKDRPWGDDRRYPEATHKSLGAEFEDFMDAAGFAELRNELIAEVGSNNHRLVAAAMAEQLEPAQVPPLFAEVLDAAVAVAATPA